jgi:hypothetical protein
VSTYGVRFRWVSDQLNHLCELPEVALRRKAQIQLRETLYKTHNRINMRVHEPADSLLRSIFTLGIVS